MTATDVADYLVRKGVAFRTAHEIVGKIVLFCEARDFSMRSRAGGLALVQHCFLRRMSWM